MDYGTFRHYKNGKNYRPLFLATWQISHGSDLTKKEKRDAARGITGGKLLNNDEVFVAIHGSISGPHLGASLSPHWNSSYDVVKALWSGNAEPQFGDKVIIYVAAYGEGRIAVRLLSEFEDEIEWEGKKVRRFQPLPPTSND